MLGKLLKWNVLGLALGLLIGSVAWADCSVSDVQVFDVDGIREILLALKPMGTESFAQFGNPRVRATVLSESDAKRIFDELKLTQQIPYDFPEDGCYARANEMARIMEKEGVQAAKVFLEVSHGKTWNQKTKSWDFYTNGPELHVKSPYVKGGDVRWIWHVAPVVLVQKQGKLVPTVMDPSIFDEPVSSAQWVRAQTSIENAGAWLSYRSRYAYWLDDRIEDGQVNGYEASRLNDMSSTLKKYRAVANHRRAPEYGF